MVYYLQQNNYFATHGIGLSGRYCGDSIQTNLHLDFQELMRLMSIKFIVPFFSSIFIEVLLVKGGECRLNRGIRAENTFPEIMGEIKEED